MGSENEELFHDDILYGEQDEVNRLDRASSEEAEDYSGPERGTPFSASKQKAGVDIGGGSSASHQSSTLHASIDDELGQSGPTASPPVEIPSMFISRRTTVGSMHPAPPKGPQYPRLGTSAPIAIPNMSRWRVDARGNGQPAEAASTFIPPHQLSKQDDFMFSFTGASPSATLKRERLRTRNAILRSTGFLEPQPARGIPIPAGVSADVAIARTPVQSSLTAALTTIGEAS